MPRPRRPQQPAIAVGRIYIFTKSGSLVRTLAQPDRDGFWPVARLDTGKEMLVPAAGLVSPLDPAWELSPPLRLVPDAERDQYRCPQCRAEHGSGGAAAPASCPRCFGRGIDPPTNVVLWSEVGYRGSSPSPEVKQ